MTLYEQQETTTPSRHPERASYDEDVVHAVLDEALLAHVGFVVKERPQVLPLLFVRVGSTVYLHSSTGARPARMAARQGGIELCMEVTLVDALVLARSAFNHSANYRSVDRSWAGRSRRDGLREGRRAGGTHGQARTGPEC